MMNMRTILSPFRLLCLLAVLLLAPVTKTIAASVIAFGDGRLVVKYVARNAVRIQYLPEGHTPQVQLPDWL